MPWINPHLSVLKGSDKDTLQSIFLSLQAELSKMEKQINKLVDAASAASNKIEKGKQPWQRT